MIAVLGAEEHRQEHAGARAAAGAGRRGPARGTGRRGAARVVRCARPHAAPARAGRHRRRADARIDGRGQTHDVVVADTTALMTAVYSEIVFGDRSLVRRGPARAGSLPAHAAVRLDLPWVADGLQRDGAHVREPVDALLRAALQRHGPGYAVSAARARRAWPPRWRCCCLRPRRRPAAAPQPTRWHWAVRTCDVPDCERHLLPRG